MHKWTHRNNGVVVQGNCVDGLNQSNQPMQVTGSTGQHAKAEASGSEFMPCVHRLRDRRALGIRLGVVLAHDLRSQPVGKVSYMLLQKVKLALRIIGSGRLPTHVQQLQPQHADVLSHSAC